MSKIKSKKRKVTLIVVLSALAAILTAGGVMAYIMFRPVNFDPMEDVGLQTVCYELPEDGSSPEEHTGVENIGYMNYKLKSQTAWYAEMTGFVDAFGDFDQTISGYKQFNNGALISTELTLNPAMSSLDSAKEYCVVESENVVLWREAAGGSSTYNGINTPWKEGEPNGYDISEFKLRCGFPPSEFSVFVLNENTVKESSPVTVNADGTYTQSFILNTSKDVDENCAIYYYMRQMQHTGGLAGYPDFSSAKVTYTFDKDWQVLSCDTEEAYSAVKMGINSGCKGTSHTEYVYGDEEISTNPDYENYFKDYVANFAPPKEDKDLTAFECVTAAFADVVNGEAGFDIKLNIDDKAYEGIIRLDITKPEVNAQFADLRVYLKEGSDLYIAYGDNTKLKLSLNELSLPETQGEEAAPAAEEGESTDGVLNKLINVLMDEEKFSLNEDKTAATLTPVLDLGELLGVDLDLKINLAFAFDIAEGKQVSLNNVSASFNLLGSDISAELKYTDLQPAPLTDEAEFVKAPVSGVLGLISSEAIGLDLNYSGNGVTAAGKAIVNLSNTAVKADLKLNLGEGAAKNLSVIYSDGQIYLSIYSDGESAAKLKLSASEGISLIKELLPAAQSEESAEVDILEKVIAAVRKIGVGNILNTLLDGEFANNISLAASENGAKLTLDGNALLAAFGVDFALGNVEITLGEEDLALSALGLNAAVAAAQPFEFDESEYASATDVIPLIKDIMSAVDGGGITLGGKLSLSYNGLLISADIKKLSINWQNGFALALDGDITVGDSVFAVRAEYDGQRVIASVNGLGVELDKSQIDELVDTLSPLLGGTLNLGETPFAGGLDTQNILNLVNALKIGGGDGIFALEIGGAKITLTPAPEGSIAGLEASYLGDGISLDFADGFVAEYSPLDEAEVPAEYIEGDEVLSLVKSIIAIVENKGLNLSGSANITFGGQNIALDVKGLSLSFAESKLALAAEVELKYGELDKTLYISYENDVITLNYDGVGVTVNETELNELIKAVQKLLGSIGGSAAEFANTLSNLSNPVSFDKDDILSLLKELKLSKSEDGGLKIELGALNATIGAEDGGLDLGLNYSSEKIGVSLGLEISEYSKMELPDCDYFEGYKIVTLINGVTPVIEEGGVNLSGSVVVPTGGTNLVVNVDNLAVKWKTESGKAEIRGAVTVKYSGIEKTLFVDYGAEGVLLAVDGIALNLSSGDFAELERAALGLYNAIAGELKAGGKELPEIKGLDINSLKELIGDFIPADGVSADKILNNLTLAKEGEKFAVYYGDTVRATLQSGNGGILTAELGVKVKDIEIKAKELKVKNYSLPAMPEISEENTFNGGALVPLIDEVCEVIKEGGVSLVGDISLDLGGVELGVKLTKVSINWKEGLSLFAEGEIALTKEGRAKYFGIEYSGDALTIVYDGAGVKVNVKDEELLSAILKICNDIPALKPNGKDAQSLSEVITALADKLKSKAAGGSVASIVNGLTLSRAEGNLKISLSSLGLDITLKNNGKEAGILSADINYNKDKISVGVKNAEIRTFEAGALPKVQLLEKDYVLPLIGAISGAVEKGGVSLSGVAKINTSLGEITIDIAELSLGWKENLTLWLDGSITLGEGAQKAIKAEYSCPMSLIKEGGVSALEKGEIKLLYDGLRVDMGGEKLEEFINSLLSVYHALSNKPSKTLELSADKILSLVEKLGLTAESGKLNLKFGDLAISLASANTGVGVELGYGKTVALSATLKEFNPANEHKFPAEGEVTRVKADDLLPIINYVKECVISQGITLKGDLVLTVKDTQIDFSVSALSINWSEGVKVKLDARLKVGGSAHDVYAEFAGGVLSLVIGDGANGVGVQLNLNKAENEDTVSDLKTIETAIIALYNELSGFVNKVVTTSDNQPLLPVLSGTATLKDLLGAFTDISFDTSGESESLFDIINKITFSGAASDDERTGIIGLALEIKGVEAAIDITKNKESGKVEISLDVAGINLHLYDTEIETRDGYNGETLPATLLKAGDIAEIVDYLSSVISTFAGQSFDLSLKGCVTSTAAEYANIMSPVDNAKYVIDAGLQYLQGDEYPLHLEITRGQEGEKDSYNFWVSPDVYAHIYVNMISTLPSVDSVLFDIYIFDGNPEVSNGKTTSAALTKDGSGLDVYMSIGKIPNDDTHKNEGMICEPVKIYAPVEEIMTVISAGAAMLDIGSVKIAEHGILDEDIVSTVNGVISSIGETLNEMLISKYLPYTQDQFASLGASLIPQLLGGSLSDKLNELLENAFGYNSDDSNQAKARGGVAEQGRDRVSALNSFKLEGGKLVVGVGETTATLTKERVDGKSRFTGLNIDGVKLKNDGEALKNLDISVKYEGVSAPESLSGYYDLRGIDTLLETLVNAATHKVESGEVISGNPGVRAQYALNSNFFLKGTLDVNLNVISVVKADLKIDVKGVSVTLDNYLVENGKDKKSDIFINVRLHVDKTDAKAIGFIPINVIQADTDVDLSFGLNSGMIYIKRVASGQTIYRAFPASAFTADIMDHLGFILNFSDTVTNVLNKIDMSGNNEKKPVQDYGTQLATYFKSLSSNCTAERGEWTIVLNGAGLIDYLGDITIKFGANAQTVDGETRYVADSLSLDATMSVSGAVEITLSGDKNEFTYCNPQQEWQSAEDQAAHDDMIANDPANDVCGWVGGVTSAELKSVIDWDRLLEESGSRYLEFVLDSNGQMVSKLKYEEVEANFFVKSEIDPASAEISVLTGARQSVLRNTDTNTVYSQFNYPDISAYEREGYKLVWQTPQYENGTYKVCAKYMPKMTLKFYSAVPLNYAKTVTGIEGYSGEVYTRTTTTMTSGYVLTNAKSLDYTFLGWYYCNPQGEWIKVTNLCNVEGVENLTEMELHAVWAGALTVDSFTCVYEQKNDGFLSSGQNHYNAIYKINVEIIAPTNMDISVQFNLTLYANNKDDMETNGTTVNVGTTRNGFMYTVETSTNDFTHNSKLIGAHKKAHMNVGYTVSCNGEEFELFRFNANEETHFTCDTVKQ